MALISAKPMKYCKDRCARFVTEAALVCLAVSFAFGLYWGVFDYRLHPVEEILTPTYASANAVAKAPEPGDLELPAVYPGDILYVHYHLDILRSCRSEFNSSFLNDRTKVVTIRKPHGGLAPNLGETSFTTEIRIPEDLLPGVYKFFVRGTYWCNPVWPLETRYAAIEFEVI